MRADRRDVGRKPRRVKPRVWFEVVRRGRHWAVQVKERMGELTFVQYDSGPLPACRRVRAGTGVETTSSRTRAFKVGRQVVKALTKLAREENRHAA